jgi:hypothetical protein
MGALKDAHQKQELHKENLELNLVKSSISPSLSILIGKIDSYCKSIKDIKNIIE